MKHEDNFIESSHWMPFDRLRQDVRYAFRQVKKSPSFALTAVLTMALGIGGTTAIFSLVHSVLLRSLPVASPDQLYRVGDNIRFAGTSRGLKPAIACSLMTCTNTFATIQQDLRSWPRSKTIFHASRFAAPAVQSPRSPSMVRWYRETISKCLG